MFTLISVSAEIFIGFGIAYLIRKPFRGRALLRIVFLIPWLVSPIANGLMWHYLFNRNTGILNYGLGLLNLSPMPSPLGLNGLALPVTILTDIWRKWPLVSFLLLPGLSAIPEVFLEQATLEGASSLRQIRHVVLPVLRPLLLTITLLLVGDAIGVFDSIIMLTGGGPGIETLTPALYSYQQAFTNKNWPLGVASSWLVVVAVMLIGLCHVILVRQEPE